ncbi:recombination mediator RecR [Pontibacter sp. G13]|uniref:recombination mediator RecR n=1 Tax=Pontibacter sp. G13 TaxID=3074898 RepID=UPI00288A954A|nr:recombination mediator RecR [Pontibacter sp. G13]WNJ15975.1 recombination mediator RecR [Pontibacter sp. G13]
MEYPSKRIEDAVNELSNLPGIGKKTALRLALHILKQPETAAQQLGQALIEMRTNISYCKVCHNISDDDICHICSHPRRNKGLVCVVEDTKDVMALESTHQYHGVYHVLGGLINPLQGIGPSMLNIDSLVERVVAGEIEEVIFAFTSNIEGDTTAFYLSKKLAPHDVKVSSIARGIPVGTDLEFTDEVTLARSIVNRVQLTSNPNP